MDQKPDGIIVTIGANMLKEHGYRHWLRNFLDAMNRHDEDWYYWLKTANQPREELRDDLRFVYLCIGGKIRFRAYFAGSKGPGVKVFYQSNRVKKEIMGNAWILMSGPIVHAPRPIERKGFQGFRYTNEIF